MIKFSGDLSEDCKYYYLRNAQKINFFVFLFVSIVFIGIAIIMGIFCDWIFFVSIAPICPILIVVVSLPPKSKLYNKINKNLYYQDIHCEIEIIDEVIYASMLNRNESKDFVDVKKVVDMGDWYKFYFYFPHKSNIFICEKKSLVEGTPEEFEELFKDRLVKVDYKKAK